MPFILPSRPNLVRLKRLAKDLLSAARRGDAQALQRFHDMFAGVSPATVTLSQAQSVLARGYGCPSWRGGARAGRGRGRCLVAGENRGRCTGGRAAPCGGIRAACARRTVEG